MKSLKFKKKCSVKGSFPTRSDKPVILGHEFVGTITSMGSEVTKFEVGAKVVVNPYNGCNNCDCCHRGAYHHCQTGGLNSAIGIYRNGGWATHVVVSDNQVEQMSQFKFNILTEKI